MTPPYTTKEECPYKECDGRGTKTVAISSPSWPSEPTTEVPCTCKIRGKIAPPKEEWKNKFDYEVSKLFEEQSVVSLKEWNQYFAPFFSGMEDFIRKELATAHSSALEAAKGVVPKEIQEENQQERWSFGDRFPGGFGCCGEEIDGYNLARTDFLKALDSLHNNYKKDE